MRSEAFLLNGVITVFVGFDYAEHRPVLPPARGALVIRIETASDNAFWHRAGRHYRH